MEKYQINLKKVEGSSLIVDIVSEERVFKDIKLAKPPKCEKCSRNYRYECYRCHMGLCPKVAEVLEKVFEIGTGLIFVVLVLWGGRLFEMNFVQNVIYGILVYIILDMICTPIEILAPKVVEKLCNSKVEAYIKKSSKNEKKQEKKDQKAEKKRQEEALSKDIYYKNVCDAEALVKKFEELANSFDLGANAEKTGECIARLREIINQLKDNSSRYAYVAVLFEAYVPELYNMFSYYSGFVKAGIVDKKKEELLSESLTKFSKYLDTKKVAVIIDKDNSEIMFESTAKVLNDIISKEDE